MSKITQYAALASPAPTDVLAIVDIDDTTMALSGTTKKITVANLASGLAPSGDTSGAADLANIQALLNLAGASTLQSGAWYVNGALSVPTGALIQGAGEDSTIINQLSTTADTFSATDQRYITIRDLQLNGPGSGSGRGIALLHSSAAVAGINLENVIVQNFGGDGIHLETVITSVLTKVRSQSNGGHGFFANNGTSVSFTACYGNANTGNGYELDAMNYMQLDACAADNDTIGYSVNGSSAVVLNACGSESCVDGYKVLGASANIVLQGCKVFGETGIAFWVTGSLGILLPARLPGSEPGRRRDRVASRSTPGLRR